MQGKKRTKRAQADGEANAGAVSAPLSIDEATAVVSEATAWAADVWQSRLTAADALAALPGPALAETVIEELRRRAGTTAEDEAKLRAMRALVRSLAGAVDLAELPLVDSLTAVANGAALRSRDKDDTIRIRRVAALVDDAFAELDGAYLPNRAERIECRLAEELAHVLGARNVSAHKIEQAMKRAIEERTPRVGRTTDFLMACDVPGWKFTRRELEKKVREALPKTVAPGLTQS